MRCFELPDEGLNGERLRLRYGPDQPLVVDGESVRIRQGRSARSSAPTAPARARFSKRWRGSFRPNPARSFWMARRRNAGSRELARKLGILFQEPCAGRSHGRRAGHSRTLPAPALFEAFLPEDEAAVREALEMAGIAELGPRRLRQLSGGQKQLAWIAMAVAQSPEYLLLDEPTTFLDLAHQFEVMDLLLRLNRELGMTICAVVHD